ncbi:MAG: hypothetical protein ACFFAO_18085, partial [Candidatus Hermodarchaeota archaeon]
AMGFVLLFFGLFILFGGVAFVEGVFNKEKIGFILNEDHLSDNAITSAETSNDTQVLEQLYYCNYCGKQIPSSIVQEFLDGKVIKCEYCNSDVSREIIN